EAQIARLVGIKQLRLPAGDVAAQALRVVMPGDAAATTPWRDERIGGVRVRRLRPSLVRLRMALAAFGRADEPLAAGMRPRLDAQLGEAQLLQLLLIIRQQLEHVGRIREA